MTITRRSLMTGAFALPLVASEAYAVDPHFYRPYPQAPSRRNPRFDDLLFLDRDGLMRGSRDLRGRVIFMHFWGSWCRPCVKEIPRLAELQSRFAQDPRIAFVFLNGYEAGEKSRQFLERVQARVDQYDIIGTPTDRFASTLNAVGHRRKLTDDYQIKIYPTTLLIDRNGLAIAHYGQANGNWMSWVPLLQDFLEHSAPFSGDDSSADLGWMTGDWRSDNGHVMRLAGNRLQLSLHWTLPDAAASPCQPVLHYANSQEAYLSVDLPDGSRCKLTLAADGRLSGARQMPERGTVILPMAMQRA